MIDIVITLIVLAPSDIVFKFALWDGGGGGEQKGRGFFPALTRHQTPDSEDMSVSVLRLQLEMKK